MIKKPFLTKAVMFDFDGTLTAPGAIDFAVIKKESSQFQPIESTSSSQQPTSVQFKKEGKLSFLRKGTNKPIKTIDIEIAETSLERQQGLMYRNSIPDSIGMLFIFDEAELRSFWMKDTYISLDILYLNEKKEIITIHRNTKPKSEESILSYKNAQYVVKVAGGFCDKYDIKEGDFIEYESFE